jgi:murein DD-endopeptidase MepM/ murein hydrolase activator NlpD
MVRYCASTTVKRIREYSTTDASRGAGRWGRGGTVFGVSVPPSHLRVCTAQTNHGSRLIGGCVFQATKMKIRNDTAGSGEYGARRGARTHRGIDFECTPGAVILAPVTARVARLGYPYADDLSWRLVELVDDNGLEHRVFYIYPVVSVGATVASGTPIGVAQDISKRYPNRGMLPHVHYEVRRGKEYINPETFVTLGRTQSA